MDLKVNLSYPSPATQLLRSHLGFAYQVTNITFLADLVTKF